MYTDFDSNREEPSEDIQENEDAKQLREALFEYADFLDKSEKEPFLLRLESDPDFRACMIRVISEMSMFIAGAAILDEEDEFRALHNDVLFDGINDTSEMRAMRLFYLKNGAELDMERIMKSDAEIVRYAKRLESFATRYVDIHPN